MKKILLGSVIFILQACGYTPADKPSEACSDMLVQSQVRVSARSEQLVDEMIGFLSSQTLTELNPENTDAANQLAAPMRDIFIAHHEIASNDNGEPIPITAGSGFGTLSINTNNGAEPENLFGIYQANTPSATCNYPFSPKSPRPINPDDANSDDVPFVASKVMSLACNVLSSCNNMDSSLFLNISNNKLHGTQNKFFFDDATYDTSDIVYKTFAGWHPGDAAMPSTDWASAGFSDYQQGDMSGHYVIYKQSNFQQYILLFYKPFEDKNGGFAGVAYAFVNLYEEYLVNDQFISAVSDGICTAPPRNCTTGE